MQQIFLKEKNWRQNQSIIPRDRRILMKKRQNLQRKINKVNSQPSQERIHEKIKEIETQLKTSIKNQQIREERQAVENIKGNSRYFFSYANKKLRTTSAVGPLIKINGDLTGDVKQMADILKDQYESVFSTPRAAKAVTCPHTFFTDAPNSPDQLTTISITETEIIAAIDEIAPDAAPGPDGFHPQFLKKCKNELAKPLKYLWSKSLETGTVPEILKTGIITPIHKGGSRGLASQYRPVVLTSHLIKICERIIKAKMMMFLEVNNHINNGQHGFRRGHSCLSQLLVHYENILEGLKEGANVDVIYLDFAKAFDKVDHGILLHKLRKLGICGKLGEWLHSFLTDCVQYSR